MFVHTYFRSYAIIIDVTPPIHYIVFATPHKTKYLLLKRSATPLAFFIYLNIIMGVKKTCVILGNPVNL